MESSSPPATATTHETTMHIMMFPWLAYGHINPFIQLARKIIAVAGSSIRVTFLITKGNVPRVTTLLPSTPLISLLPIDLPHVPGLPPGAESTAEVTADGAELLKIALDKTKPQVEDILMRTRPNIVITDFVQMWLPSLAKPLDNLCLASGIITAATQYMQHDDLEEGRPLNRMLLKVNRRKENVLHHAMRNGFENLALQLLEIEPRLCEQVKNTGESPMHMAARRGYSRVTERLLQIPSSADCGPTDESALHAATKFGQAGITKKLLQGWPQLAYHKDKNGNIPLQRAIIENNLELVKIFLEYDHNLAYIKFEDTKLTTFSLAVQKGYLSIAKEIMSTCPYSIYTPDSCGDCVLNHAIIYEKPDLIEYILRTPQLHRFINQTNNDGLLPLHHAASKCDPKLLHSLLSHAGQDYTAVNVNSSTAVNIVYAKTHIWKTLKWNESFTLLTNLIPSSWKYTIRDKAKQTIKKQAIEEVKSLTNKYTSNTSLVAALLATITFAAAFTLPGGFSTNTSDAGQPLFARKAAFQVFLISDTIAMCSSLAVAFLCILATWEDLDFLLNYRKAMRALMWCAYEATALAFGTGLFTVLAPNNLWLAILILVLCTILPLLSKIIGEWPLLMLRYRLRGLFRKDLLPSI